MPCACGRIHMSFSSITMFRQSVFDDAGTAFGWCVFRVENSKKRLIYGLNQACE